MVVRALPSIVASFSVVMVSLLLFGWTIDAARTRPNARGTRRRRLPTWSGSDHRARERRHADRRTASSAVDTARAIANAASWTVEDSARTRGYNAAEAVKAGVARLRHDEIPKSI